MLCCLLMLFIFGRVCSFRFLPPHCCWRAQFLFFLHFGFAFSLWHICRWPFHTWYAKSLILCIQQRALFHSIAQCSTNEPTLHNKCVNCHFHFLFLSLFLILTQAHKIANSFVYVCVSVHSYYHRGVHSFTPYLTCLLWTFVSIFSLNIYFKMCPVIFHRFTHIHTFVEHSENYDCLVPRIDENTQLIPLSPHQLA